MRSRDADRFDHDVDAADYDRKVADESSLIRRGYAACLRALAEDLRRGSGPDALPIVELGAGTGALTTLLPTDHPIVAVDLSAAMLAVAGPRLAGRPVTFVESDLLAFLTEADTPLGTVASTFALHLLHPDEKALALEHIAARMVPGCRLCIGDLGFTDATAKQAFLDGPVPIDEPEAVLDTYFWDWSLAEDQLRSLGFRVRRRAHGPLISSLIATRDAPRDAGEE